MQYEYKIDDEDKIIHQTFKGEFSMDNLKSAFMKVTNDPNFNPNYNILTDLRECIFNFLPKELESFIPIFKEKLAGSKGKSALLLDTPYETAISSLHQDEVKNTRSIRLFSTFEAAIIWLKSGF